MPILRPQSTLPAYAGLTAFAGDIHNHCEISYGHGSIEDAYRNARLQLDFATVTGHASWHDMPAEPVHVNEYHREGFERLQAGWEHVQDVTEAAHEDGSFVSLLSFEWHSMTYGDHCVYYKSGRGPLAPAQAGSLEELRGHMRELAAEGIESMILPHHIGYIAGRRGINWESYTEELSPVVELISMHGNGEDDHAPRQYLHTMGPRDVGSTAVTGLNAGHRFGFIGSTDHHSAHPGSHGYGRAMVWADALTRTGIWEGITSRRCYAVTGDRIMLATTLNGAPMGSVVPSSGRRVHEVSVRGGSAIDYVDIVRNGEIIERRRPVPAAADDSSFNGVVSVGMGWGEIGVDVEWDVSLEIIGGTITAVEPRFHGHDVVAPTETEPESFSFSAWNQLSDRLVTLQTRSQGNPTVLTDAGQRFALHIEGDSETVLVATVNGQRHEHTVGELLAGPRVKYLGGFLTGAFVFDSAVPSAALDVNFRFEDAGSGDGEDWYYVRVRQHNEQYAWSSPIWVEAASEAEER